MSSDGGKETSTLREPVADLLEEPLCCSYYLEMSFINALPVFVCIVCVTAVKLDIISLLIFIATAEALADQSGDKMTAS